MFETPTPPPPPPASWFPAEDRIENWQRFFPLDSFRKYQEKTIQACLDAWKSGKRYVILEGCTGSGKSIIGATLGLIFGNAWATTPQKMLQDQYIRDFNEFMVELKGRSNYPCLRINFETWSEGYRPAENLDYISQRTWESLPPENELRRFTCASAPCCTRSKKVGQKIRKQCKESSVCAYINQRDLAMASEFALLNFSNLLLFTQLMPDVYEKRPLLIVDECHVLENFLYEFASISLTRHTLKPLEGYLDESEFAQITQPFYDMEQLIDYLEKSLFPAFDRHLQAKKITEGADVGDDVKDEFAAGNVENELERMINLRKKLGKFIKERPTDRSHVIIPEKTIEGGHDICVGTKIKPFSVAGMSGLAFGSSNSKVLLMSATILDAGTYCRSLGIDPKDAIFMSVPSTFPAENRPIIADLTVGSMSYSQIEKTTPKMHERIVELLEKHCDQKGIIHTGNYAIMSKLERFLKTTHPKLYGRVLFQKQGSFTEKSLIIRRHAEAAEPLVLCGPGFIEGLDLKDDLSRFNILMKLPYMSLADPLIKRKAEEFSDWYSLQTALAIIQAVGRSVRSDKDWAVNYILDSLFKWFYQQNIKLFPKHIRESIQWLTAHGTRREVV